MLDRRRLLAALAALLLPAPLAARAAAPALPAPAAPRLAGGVRLVDGWLVTERDLEAIARLDPRSRLDPRF